MTIETNKKVATGNTKRAYLPLGYRCQIRGSKFARWLLASSGWLLSFSTLLFQLAEYVQNSVGRFRAKIVIGHGSGKGLGPASLRDFAGVRRDENVDVDKKGEFERRLRSK